MTQERLQKVLAKAGISSRRGAEELIRQGRVRVDGEIVTEMGVQVDPTRQTISCDGKPLPRAEGKIYLLLNKPKGYVTTMDDPQGRPIVSTLITGLKERVFPVGRLDVDTEGALIMTNDGDFAEKILHPRFEIPRTYQARVQGHPTKEKIRLLEEGIELEGRRTWPAQIGLVQRGAASSTFTITIHEGRKRQVRKMFQLIGHRVIDLKRIAYGALELGELKSGSYRKLEPADLALIFLKNLPRRN